MLKWSCAVSVVVFGLHLDAHICFVLDDVSISMAMFVYDRTPDICHSIILLLHKRHRVLFFERQFMEL